MRMKSCPFNVSTFPNTEKSNCTVPGGEVKETKSVRPFCVNVAHAECLTAHGVEP